MQEDAFSDEIEVLTIVPPSRRYVENDASSASSSKAIVQEEATAGAEYLQDRPRITSFLKNSMPSVMRSFEDPGMRKPKARVVSMLVELSSDSDTETDEGSNSEEHEQGERSRVDPHLSPGLTSTAGVKPGVVAANADAERKSLTQCALDLLSDSPSAPQAKPNRGGQIKKRDFQEVQFEDLPAPSSDGLEADLWTGVKVAKVNTDKRRKFAGVGEAAVEAVESAVLSTRRQLDQPTQTTLLPVLFKENEFGAFGTTALAGRTSSVEERQAKATLARKKSEILMTLAQEKEAKKVKALEEKAVKVALAATEAAEKKALRDANVLKSSKEDCVSELRIHASGSALIPTMTNGYGKAGVGKKRKESPWKRITEELGVRMSKWECPLMTETPTNNLSCEGSMRWTRFCNKKWDIDRAKFVPLQAGHELVVDEDTRLVLIMGEDVALHVGNNTLLEHFKTVSSAMPAGTNLFIMTFGLQKMYRSMANAAAAAYRKEVRSNLDATNTVSASSLKAKQSSGGETNSSQESIELALMRLQVVQKCFTIHVENENEAIDWLEQLTFDIGRKPYQRLKMLQLSALGVGAEERLPSGKDLQDIYTKMLSSIKGVTESVAKRIVAQYPTLRTLYESYAACANEREKEGMLLGIGRGSNVNGTITHRQIGISSSKHIYKVLCSKDPGMFL